MICEIDYTQQHWIFPERNQDIAWVNSTQQRIEQSSDKTLSALYMRKTEAFCVDKDKYKKGLLAGRKCFQDAQCY